MGVGLGGGVRVDVNEELGGSGGVPGGGVGLRESGWM